MGKSRRLEYDYFAEFIEKKVNNGLLPRFNDPGQAPRKYTHFLKKRGQADPGKARG